MKLICVLLITSMLASYSAKTQDLTKWSQDTLDLANTAGHLSHFTPEEKKMIQLINLARLDGTAFLNRVAKPYIKANDKDEDEFVTSLYADLRNTKGLHLLQPLDALHKSASHHASDMGTRGQFGKDSSDGTTFTMRIHKFHKQVTVSENCSYGFGDGLSNVMEMLIDEGVSTKMHRHNLLGQTFHHLGVSIKPHKMMDFNCVIDFAVE